MVRATLLLALALSVVRVSAASAQSLGGFPGDDSRTAVFLEASLEPELVLSIGYLYRVTAAPSAASLHVGAGLEVPPYLVKNGSLRTNLVVRGRWVGESGWGAAVTSMAYFARNRNRAGTMHGLGLETRAAPGYFGSRWSVAADLGWQTTLLTHVEHSALVRDTFEGRYPDGTSGPGSGAGAGPRDGWYGVTASRVRLGISGARAISDNLSIRLAAGSLFSLQSQGLFLSFAHGQVPVYLETAVRGSW